MPRNLVFPKSITPIYPPKLRPGCVLHIDMQDTGNKLIDHSGFNNHGVNYGSVSVAGPGGQVRSFDGVDDYITVPSSNSLKLTEEITVIAWFKINPQGEREFIVTKWVGFTVELDAYNCLIGGVLIDGTQRSTAGTSILPNNTWVNATFTYSSSTRTLKTYLNGGKEIKTAPLSGLATYSMSVSDASLGIGNYSTFFYKGRIGKVCIYNRALPAAEIAEIYAEEAWRYNS